MKILLVEDDQKKLTKIIDFLGEIVPNSVIEEARSYQSCLSRVIKTKYDLILLDMTMPTFDISPSETGGRPRAFAGYDILRQMKRRDINTHVIVVTQFDSFGDGSRKMSLEQLSKKLHQEFPMYVDSIYYNAAMNSWQTELNSFIKKIMERE